MSNHGMAIQFALERNYECARQCLLDACFVANEREYHGAWRDKKKSCVYRDYHGCPDKAEWGAE